MFLTSLENVALLLLMAVPAFIITKLKMLKNIDGATNFISVLLLYVCQPFITVNSFLNTAFDPSILWNMLAVFTVTIILLVALVYVGKLFTIKSKNPDTKTIVPYAGSFGNMGYMCIPFLQILVPDNSTVILYATCSIVAFNLVSWTLGNYVLTGDKKFISIKKAVLNPPFISFILVLPLFILNLNFVGNESLSGLANVCKLFANLVGPLAMTLLGIKFAQMQLKEVFLDWRPYLASGIKLIISPAIVIVLLLIMRTFMDISAVRLNIVALAAMPAANNIMMFSSLYGKDVKLSAKMVLVSTLASIVTIPVFLYIGEAIFA